MKPTNLIVSSIVAVLALVGVISPVQAQFEDPTVSNLGDVLIRYCNEDAQGVPGEMKSLFLETQAGDPTDICIYINNSGPTDVDVILNFVDGTITADESQNKACQPEGTTSNFGQYVEYDREIITVPADGTVQTNAQVTFPEGYAGLSYGCVTMQFAPEEGDDSSDAMFNVLSRRGYFADFLVAGDFDLGLNILKPTTEFDMIGSSDEFVVYRTDQGIYKASLTVENPGNIAQNVTVLPTFKALLTNDLQGRNITSQSIVNNEIKETTSIEWTASQDAKPVTKKVLPDQSVTFEFELNDALPRRNGPITIDATLTHVPSLDFVSAQVSDELKKVTTRQFTTSFFVMPWLPLAALILLIVLLLFMTDKKTKKKD